MTDSHPPLCADCRHMVIRNFREMCNSLQVNAGYGGATGANFERDTFENEFNRDRPATRKCGTGAVNFTRRTA